MYTKSCPAKARRKDCMPTFSSYKQVFHASNKHHILIGIKMRISSWKPPLNSEEGPEYAILTLSDIFLYSMSVWFWSSNVTLFKGVTCTKTRLLKKFPDEGKYSHFRNVY